MFLCINACLLWQHRFCSSDTDNTLSPSITTGEILQPSDPEGPSHQRVAHPGGEGDARQSRAPPGDVRPRCRGVPEGEHRPDPLPGVGRQVPGTIGTIKGAVESKKFQNSRGGGSRSHSEFFFLENRPKIYVNQY